MLNPYQKKNLKIRRPHITKRLEGKPNIVATFQFLCPDSPTKRTNRAIMGLCPIHGESNPSFAMYEETNTYYCFSCQATGDSYKLIMELENCDFKQSLEIAKQNRLYD